MLGEKYASITPFSQGEFDDFGRERCLKWAMETFYAAARRDPQCVLVFDASVRQEAVRDGRLDMALVRTTSYAIRNQFAIGP